MTDIDYPELPDGWEWWSGDRSPQHYTRWFGTERTEDGYEGQVYWDDPQLSGVPHHHVLIYPILGVREDGDPDVSEYPDVNEKFDSEQEAVNAVPELIESLEDNDD